MYYTIAICRPITLQLLWAKLSMHFDNQLANCNRARPPTCMLPKITIDVMGVRLHPFLPVPVLAVEQSREVVLTEVKEPHPTLRIRDVITVLKVVFTNVKTPSLP